jgi:hypothetical protein
VAATGQDGNQDEPDLWMPDSKNFGVGGKMRQTNARKMRCPNKSASGNHLSQNEPHPPLVDDKNPCSKFCCPRAIRAYASLYTAAPATLATIISSKPTKDAMQSSRAGKTPFSQISKFGSA